MSVGILVGGLTIRQRLERLDLSRLALQHAETVLRGLLIEPEHSQPD